MKKQVGNVVVHEVVNEQHRLVLLLADGTVEASEWIEVRHVANLKEYFAVVGESPLPQGVFTCRVVAHRLLG